MINTKEDIKFIVTSQSPRRIAVISRSDPNAMTVSVSGGPEQVGASPSQVAVGKKDFAIQMLRQEFGPTLADFDYSSLSAEAAIYRDLTRGSESIIFVSADTNNSAGGEHLFSKPSSIQEAREMLRLTALYGWYWVIASNLVQNGVSVLGSDQALVELNELGVKTLKSKEGQDDYFAYLMAQFGPEIIWQLSGGLMLEALLALGLVKAVDGVRPDAQNADQAIVRPLDLALVGILPEVVAQVHPAAGKNMAKRKLAQEYLGRVRGQTVNRP